MARYRYLVILQLVFMTGQVKAADITIQGQVVSTPCIVDVDTQSKHIELGKVISHNLKERGSGSNWTDFHLLLSGCAANLLNVTATFTGMPNENSADTYRNQGTARDVSLQMTSADHRTIYGTGSSMTVNIDGVTHKAKFPLSARIVSPAGDAKGGTFSAAVSVHFIYQ